MAHQGRTALRSTKDGPNWSTDRVTDPLLQRLNGVGLDDVVWINLSTEGLAAVAGLATLRSGTVVFAKTLAVPLADDVFALEAEGLRALHTCGGLPTPDVVHVGSDVLVLSALQPQPTSPAFCRVG